ncbi:AAA family ATPase [Pantoea agglomerans]|uniref:AAA family ATPase n=1 Tax=Enterobacter agglomerans TaxID=549 RepID=UPI00177CC23E|nr:AAA family ATPase [Pantoea agglomerans]MBD8133870.1 AAA family ATPase [Pantoea agglomerans]
MISNFSGINYKAFEEFNVQLKPLTILLGANSCGKSAILNSFLMLAQSLDSSSQSEMPLRLNGNRVGMGEPLNIIKDKNEENSLGFTFEVDSIESTNNLIEGIKRDFLESHFSLARFLAQKLRKEKKLQSLVKTTLESIDEIFYRSENPSKSQLKLISLRIIQILKIHRNNPGRLFEDEKIKMPDPIANYIRNVSYNKISECFAHLLSLQSHKLCAKKITIIFKYNKKTESIIISEFTLYNEENNIILSLSVKDRDDLDLKSDIIDNAVLRRSRQDFKKTLNLKSLLICNVEGSLGRVASIFNSETSNPIATYFSKILGASFKELKNSFSGENISHVSPLRAFPQRYYLLDKAIYHKQLNSMDGTELAEILKNRKDIVKSINDLLIKFNITIEIDKVNDIIHKIIVNQDAVKLELTDVGFGISQVLPILVQALLSPMFSITIIEQPEIHLHPKMQAWLTDALIDIAVKNNKIFIIETHSDALVRRLRLRIVDDESALTEEHVSIYYLERDRKQNKTNMCKMEVTSEGDISWPSEFMDIEIRDTLLIQKKKIERIMKSHLGDKNA